MVSVFGPPPLRLLPGLYRLSLRSQCYRTRCPRRHLLPSVRYVLPTIFPIILFKQGNMKQKQCTKFLIRAQVTLAELLISSQKKCICISPKALTA